MSDRTFRLSLFVLACVLVLGALAIGGVWVSDNHHRATSGPFRVPRSRF